MEENEMGKKKNELTPREAQAATLAALAHAKRKDDRAENGITNRVAHLLGTDKD
jgi:hypothetical protein